MDLIGTIEDDEELSVVEESDDSEQKVYNYIVLCLWLVSLQIIILIEQKI